MLFYLFQLFFPCYCPNCNQILQRKESLVCQNCFSKIPFRLDINNENLKNNLELYFSIEKAYSLLYFKEQIVTTNLIKALKYKNKPLIGFELGILLGKNIFSNLDLIIPIPLHPKKENKRGYNQAEMIAKGISKQLNIPINTKDLVRIKNNPSQALLKNKIERIENTLDIFEVQDATFFKNKHILLVDDVITTGSTIYNCAYELLKIENVKISIACISFAG